MWIANRDDPVQDLSGIVIITRNGNLAVVDGRENTTPFGRQAHQQLGLQLGTQA